MNTLPFDLQDSCLELSYHGDPQPPYTHFFLALGIPEGNYPDNCILCAPCRAWGSNDPLDNMLALGFEVFYPKSQARKHFPDKCFIYGFWEDGLDIFEGLSDEPYAAYALSIAWEDPNDPQWATVRLTRKTE